MSSKNRLQTISQLPGPKGLPILGNLLQLDLGKLHLILEKWADFMVISISLRCSIRL